MQHDKLVIGISIVAVAVVAGWLGGSFSAPTNVIRYVTKEVQPIIQQLGSASSPSIVNGCMEVNGVLQCSYKAAMTNSSTTCAFKLPNATTTLQSFVAHFSNPTGAFITEMGVGPQIAGAAATTTQIAELTPTVNGRAQTLSATSSMGIAPNELTDYLLPPNQFLTVRVGSSSPTLAGTCAAVVFGI